ncbi:hypothetical protein oki361_23970 [Helicobacter pylori]
MLLLVIIFFKNNSFSLTMLIFSSWLNVISVNFSFTKLNLATFLSLSKTEILILCL